MEANLPVGDAAGSMTMQAAPTGAGNALVKDAGMSRVREAEVEREKAALLGRMAGAVVEAGALEETAHAAGGGVSVNAGGFYAGAGAARIAGLGVAGGDGRCFNDAAHISAALGGVEAQKVGLGSEGGHENALAALGAAGADAEGFASGRGFANDAVGDEAREAALALLAREFPEAVTEGTELFEACREELAYLREARSPLADDPQAEYKIARRMARVLGTARNGAPAAAQNGVGAQNGAEGQQQNAGGAAARVVPREWPRVAARRSLRPMPTGGMPVESPVVSLEQRVAGASSTGEMLSLMREFGTPFEALLRRR